MLRRTKPDLSAKFPQGPIDHASVRGAKKGGITEHISGPHLIPNVGREAMVPAEIVCRRKHPAPKKKAPEPKAVPKPEKKDKRRKEHRFKEKDAPRHREERRYHSDSSSSDERNRDRSREADRASPDVETRKRTEEQRISEELERRRQEEEEKRFQEEQRKLKELEEVRKKKQEIDSARRQKLGGLFALTEEDMAEEDNADAQKARLAQERARAMERRAQERPVPEDVKPQAYSQSQSAVVAAVPRAAASSAALAQVDDGNITAVDLDGSQHDHKFSKVWKDWDASKKSDPGEVARQFMKIAAIKRRGYTGGPGDDSGRPGSSARPPPRRSASRSRSRGRRRR
mmetsp:Transcript_33984/g.60104  ORF Transcript_33984/g.60104 Transcript_33984/m.60104 type:complete len:343 (-) Transcript_33984:94-1122(-)